MDIKINAEDSVSINSFRPMREAINYKGGRIIAIRKPALLAHGIEFRPEILGVMNDEAKKNRPGYYFTDRCGTFYKDDGFIGWIPFPCIEIKGLSIEDFWNGCGHPDVVKETKMYLESIGENGVVSDRNDWQQQN